MKFEWHKYKVRGVSEETGRKRTIKLMAQNREKAEEELKQRGLIEPYEFEEEEPDAPTDRQIDYAIDLGILILPTMTKKDISALIDKKVDEDDDANEELLTFAYNKNIYVSPYIGEKALFNTIFSTLANPDKAAFFCYAVYCSINGEKVSNLEESPYRDKFYQFAEFYAADDSFQRSLEDYSGEELIFFGTKNVGGVVEYGGSKRKKAYQVAASYIQGSSIFRGDNFRTENILPIDNDGDDFNSDNTPAVLPETVTRTPILPAEEFIVIENQVAMTEKPVAKLLGVTVEKLRELSRTVGVTNKKGGIYELFGQYVYTSFEIIFKVRDANGRDSADLSTFKLASLFAQAEKKLLSKQHRQKENRTMLKVGLIFLAIVVCASLLPDNSKGTTKAKQVSSPKVETVSEKPKPPKVETPEKSFYKESYDAIEQKTRMRATETWLLEYGERVTPDGNVDTHGFVELNNDGVKRQFWLVFDGKTRKCLRVKIGSTLVYTELNW